MAVANPEGISVPGEGPVEELVVLDLEADQSGEGSKKKRRKKKKQGPNPVSIGQCIFLTTNQIVELSGLICLYQPIRLLGFVAESVCIQLLFIPRHNL